MSLLPTTQRLFLPLNNSTCTGEYHKRMELSALDVALVFAQRKVWLDRVIEAPIKALIRRLSFLHQLVAVCVGLLSSHKPRHTRYNQLNQLNW
eukprot:m.181438 g.181438  ORF g.181438 m.181438 type:complete len:93 (-) comp14965_c0_seq2:2051-2329(-)